MIRRCSKCWAMFVTEHALDKHEQVCRGLVDEMPEIFKQDISDYADAAAAILEKAAKRIRERQSVADVANDLLPAVRLMARRT